ncbi:aminomethyl-transferring glycine dehydrogenase subunit GcvPA [bacterium]|nr:aminomethyl-transferring glycine dehydrogenase subunit GcvPA [bacterium]
MRYLPITPEDRKAMLDKIGVASVEELFNSIPADVKLTKKLNLPDAMSEPELRRYFAALAKENSGSEMLTFLGAGAYRHTSPAHIDQLLLRSEFYTAYTPYQPEVSQGTLQSIFEFQTMVADLFDMHASNASMYDGATAAAEAALMATKIKKKRDKLVIASSMHPQYIETIRTYTAHFVKEIVLLEIDPKTGMTSTDELAKIDEQTIAVMFQYPNFFGVIEDGKAISEKTKEMKALLIPVVIETTALAILQAPGELGADIAVGEGQPLGIPVNFGGPGVGLFTASEKLVRKMPGRLIGETKDKNGNDCFVLTLAAREQHIKREKATSNICSNQGLMALAAGIYLASMGPKGLEKVALMNVRRAEKLKKMLVEQTNCEIAFSGPTYNEFSLMTPIKASEFAKKMEEKGIVAGLPIDKYYPALDNTLLVTVSELHTDEELENFVSATKEITGGAK